MVVRHHAKLPDPRSLWRHVRPERCTSTCALHAVLVVTLSMPCRGRYSPSTAPPRAAHKKRAVHDVTLESHLMDTHAGDGCMETGHPCRCFTQTQVPGQGGLRRHRRRRPRLPRGERPRCHTASAARPRRIHQGCRMAGTARRPRPCARTESPGGSTAPPPASPPPRTVRNPGHTHRGMRAALRRRMAQHARPPCTWLGGSRQLAWQGCPRQESAGVAVGSAAGGCG